MMRVTNINTAPSFAINARYSAMNGIERHGQPGADTDFENIIARLQLEAAYRFAIARVQISVRTGVVYPEPLGPLEPLGEFSIKASD